MTSQSPQDASATAAQGPSPRLWILVENGPRELAFESVVRQLGREGVDAQIVTIREVLGSVAREALAGGAERLLRGFRVAFQGRASDEDFLAAVGRGKPDVLAVTNPRHIRPLGLMESLTGVATLQLGLLPDFNLAQGWFGTHLGAFVVPHGEHKDRLVTAGMPTERVLVAGPAVVPAFASPLDREAVRQELGLAGQVVALVRADGFEHALLEKIVFQSTLVDRGVRFIFHHNGDSATAATLRRAADQYRLPASMFGRVADLERYFAAADFAIVAPGDPWAPELMASGLPQLVVGQDEAFAEQQTFLVRHGAAAQLSDPLRLGAEIDRFAAPESLSAMRQAAGLLVSPAATTAVAQALLLALEHRQSWCQPVPRQGDAPRPGEPVPAPAAAPGPFETIGRAPVPGGSSAPAPSSPASSAPAAGYGGTPRTETYGASPSVPTSAAPSADTGARLSQAEAKEQLAQLIMSERDVERRLQDIERQQQRWRSRLELAREWREEELAREAEGLLRDHLAQAEPLRQELDGIRRQKEKLRHAARPAGAAEPATGANGSVGRRESEIEARFQRMEADNDLQGLKDRIRRELGE